jgi:hypothetical protein
MNKIGPRASLVLIAVFLAATTSVLAQSSGGDFELTRTTIDAGGGTAIALKHFKSTEN